MGEGRQKRALDVDGLGEREGVEGGPEVLEVGHAHGHGLGAGRDAWISGQPDGRARRAGRPTAGRAKQLIAQADLPGFKVQLSTQFGVPLPTVETIIAQVRLPGDAFPCLQLGQMARKPPERVVQTYQRSHGKGWGAIAKELGIKTGSPEFHALKCGDFIVTGEPSGANSNTGKSKGKANGKDKGQPG
jgi:hypothetical protein